jgi:hypothetical protein
MTDKVRVDDKFFGRLFLYSVFALTIIIIGQSLIPREEPLVIHRGGRVLVLQMPANSELQQEITIFEPSAALNESARVSRYYKETGQSLDERRLTDREWQEVKRNMDKICAQYERFRQVDEDQPYYRVDIACGAGTRLFVSKTTPPEELQAILALVTTENTFNK